MQMDLEYVSKILLIRLNIVNKKVYFKLNNYLINILEKHKIKYVILNINNNIINELLIESILNIKNLLDRWDGILYLCEVNNNDLTKLNKLHIKITSSEKTAFKILEV